MQPAKLFHQVLRMKYRKTDFCFINQAVVNHLRRVNWKIWTSKFQLLFTWTPNSVSLYFKAKRSNAVISGIRLIKWGLLSDYVCFGYQIIPIGFYKNIPNLSPKLEEMIFLVCNHCFVSFYISENIKLPLLKLNICIPFYLKDVGFFVEKSSLQVSWNCCRIASSN